MANSNYQMFKPFIRRCDIPATLMVMNCQKMAVIPVAKISPGLNYGHLRLPLGRSVTANEKTMQHRSLK
jgi:hypothetical protein